MPEQSTPRAEGRPMPELNEPLPLPPERRLGWAVMGLGSYALNQILPNLAATRRCRLAALVSGDADKAHAVADAYGVPRRSVYSYDTFDRIRDDPAVDVVYVILPVALHAEWTVRALEAGKHVMCEKPMASTVEECRAMIEAGERAGRRLMIGYRAHFEAHNREAIRLIRSGEIGDVKVVAGSHGRTLDLSQPADQWRAKRELAGGGALFDIGIYSLNGARYLTGEEPVEVTATWRAPQSPDPRIEVETNLEWTMRFPGGAMAVMNTSYEYRGANRIHVEGTRGTLKLDPATRYHGNALHVHTDQARRIEVAPTNQFAAQMDHLAECVMEGREPSTSGREGLRDVQIMQAIYEAARTGRAVEVPPPG